jgi:hypothetical protein
MTSTCAAEPQVDCGRGEAAPVPVTGVGRAGRPAVRGVAERGMVSAEWAVGLIAAIAIAGVLVGIVTSGPVRQALLNIILEVIGWMAIHIPG